jgi:hypothetical protein
MTNVSEDKNLPGFTAKIALYESTEKYGMIASGWYDPSFPVPQLLGCNMECLKTCKYNCEFYEDIPQVIQSCNRMCYFSCCDGTVF